MHPDEHTPESHRYTAPDSDAGRRDTPPPGAGKPDPGSKPAQPDAAAQADPEPDDKRVAEEGSAYVGRQLDDDLKAHPRVQEPGRGTEED